MGLYDETFGKISDALSGKRSVPDSGTNAGSQSTSLTADDIASVQARRNTPEFQAALKARDARNAANQNAVSGVDTAMSAHADKLHPVPK